MHEMKTKPSGIIFPRAFFLCAILPALVMVGCGGNKGGQINGHVSADGKPVTAGTLVLAPVPKSAEDMNAGAPTSIPIQPDGTFLAKTSATGTYRAVYTPPAAEHPPGYTPMPSEPAPESPFAGLTLKQNEFEISRGQNELTIELVRPTP